MTAPFSDLEKVRKLLATWQQTSGSAFGDSTAAQIAVYVPELLRRAEAGEELRKWMGRITMGVDGAKHLEDYDAAVEGEEWEQ